ncbi:MAG: XrtA system polysaccharide deacetylase [Pseudomonadota bacterium]
MPAKFAMSIDVEDYFQVWAFQDVVKRSAWDGFERRVAHSTKRCLDLLDETASKATFFVLGWVAEREPALVREIASRGHEVASHGYDHTKVTQQSREEFRTDISRTKIILEDLTGGEIRGYRAAGFSIGQSTPWAHEELAKAGYAYSSSTHPINHDHYGDPNGLQDPYYPYSDQSIIEAPVATLDWLGQRISCAGGGWFRAIPYWISRELIDRAHRKRRGPIIFYFHPWEIDVEQPKISPARLQSKIRHHVNMHSMEKKLLKLLRAYQWTRVDAALFSRAHHAVG